MTQPEGVTKPDVMMLSPLRPKAQAQAEAEFTLHRWDLATDKADFLAEYGPRCRAMVSTGHVVVNPALLDQLPQLGLLSCISAGYDTFDTAALAQRGVLLSNGSPALCDDVADMAILLMLAARRNLVAADAYVRSGDWGQRGMFPLQSSLGGKALGIVGMGAIGQAIAKRATAMNMQVSYWNRSQKDLPYAYEIDLKTLAAQSDTVIVILPGGPATAGLISAEILSALGPRGLLVNVARGSVVDEDALILALQQGELGAAALDVYASEPHPDPRLTALPNVTLSPHHASGTEEARDAMANLAVANLLAYFAGKPLLSPVRL